MSRTDVPSAPGFYNVTAALEDVTTIVRERAEVARTLLDAGADLEALTSWGATPLETREGLDALVGQCALRRNGAIEQRVSRKP